MRQCLITNLIPQSKKKFHQGLYLIRCSIFGKTWRKFLSHREENRTLTKGNQKTHALIILNKRIENEYTALGKSALGTSLLYWRKCEEKSIFTTNFPTYSCNHFHMYLLLTTNLKKNTFSHEKCNFSLSNKYL